MSRNRILAAGLLAVAAALVWVTLFRADQQAVPPDAGAPAASPAKRLGHPSPPGRPAGSGADARGAKKAVTPKPEKARKAGLGQPSAAAGAKEAGAPSEGATAEEKAVESWEALVDQLAELTDVPTHERMVSVKEAFDALDKKDQMDAIHTALNLVPDEQFTALYAILFDKQESEEVLDAIFSDALNRAEDIKIPLMKELAKDKAHPMYFESARILDATGELDNNMSGASESARQDGAEGAGQAKP